jgi:hypothetical protein
MSRISVAAVAIALLVGATLALAVDSCITVTTTTPTSTTKVDSFYDGSTLTPVALKLTATTGNVGVEYYDGSSWVSLSMNSWVTGSQIRLTANGTGTHEAQYTYKDKCSGDEPTRVIVIVVT